MACQFGPLKRIINQKKGQPISGRDIIELVKKMISDNIRHKEAIITTEFIEWFKKNKDYVELYEDKETTGSDPFDSAGIIDNDIYFIEFKNQISKSIVNYENSRGSSIEKKIGQVLQLIYTQENSNIFNSISQYYDENKIPTLIIVAEKISKRALDLLTEMLIRRSKDWQFHYKLIKWSNKKPTYLLEKNIFFQDLKKNSTIEIPYFPNTATKRNGKLNNKTLEQKLKKIEKLNEFNLLKNYLLGNNFELKYNIKSVNFTFEGKSIFGVWPFESDVINGLRMSFELEKINKLLNLKINSLEELGITRSKQKLGFLGFNGFVSDKYEMEKLLKKLKTLANSVYKK